MSPFELIAVAVTLTAVYLTTRQVIWCWPLSMASVCMYALIFREAALYAAMGLQGLYFVLAAYGWWAWLHGGEDHGELRVSLASNRSRAWAVVLAASAGVLLGAALSRFTDASLPYLDSLLAAFSIAAQWMQTRKLLENWIVWLAVDVFYVGMYLYKGLYPTAGLYALFLVLAASGFARWRRSMVQGGAVVSGSTG